MTNYEAFNNAEETIRIDRESVHIWLVDTDKLEHNQKVLSDILSIDEIERVNKFVFDKDKKQQIISRGILRLLLSRYINLGPESIRFSTIKKGKPILNHSEYQNIKFNLSHSGKYIVYAIAGNREVGIDIEYMKDINDFDQIIERFSSKKEAKEYLELPIEIRKRAFFTWWTRKEAFIKALGEGLYMPLDQFSVSPNPNIKSTIEIHNGSINGGQWVLEDVDIEDSNYVSTIVFNNENSDEFYGYKLPKLKKMNIRDIIN